MRELEIAWAGGLFEGEGCFTQNRLNPKAQLTMTDEDVARRFHAAVGFGSVSGPHRPPSRTPMHKPTWSWNAQSVHNVQALLVLFWPWLGERRRARGQEVIDRFTREKGA